MTAPNTNIEKQTRRHRGPLIGMGLGIAAVLAFILAAQIAPDDDAAPAMTSEITQ